MNAISVLKNIPKIKNDGPSRFVFRITFLPLFTFVHQYLKNTKNYKISNPIKGEDLTAEALVELQNFRDSMYGNSTSNQQYLILDEEDKRINESKFDKMGIHFIARDMAGQMVGCLRLLEKNFELEQWYYFYNNKEKNQYFEISRLLTKIKSEGLGQRLMLAAGLYAMTSTSKTGFCAVSKLRQFPLYQSFGMKSISDRFIIPGRGPSNQYVVLAASFYEIATHVVNHFFKKMIK